MAPKKKAAKSKKSNKPKASKAKPKAKAKKPAKKKSKKLVRTPSRELQEPNEAAPMVKGRGARTAGQSGDDVGLSDVDEADSESVEELVDEGQDFEAELVDAVENAPEPDEAELDAEVPEDDEDPDVRSYSKRNRL